MHIYIDIFGVRVPSYGLMITIGVLLANLLAIAFIRYYLLDFNDFIILESYSFLGAFLGAKILYLIVSFKYIEWNRMLDYDYFNRIMIGGYVFYGGLLGGIISIFICGKIHKINAILYLRKLICFIPLVHCFGRIGCYMAGCCYGIPYHGIGAVIFPEGSYAPGGVRLFPVQLFETIGLAFLFIIILLLQIRFRIYYTVEIYLICYSIMRFILEFFRNDAIRGRIFLSVSQWISLMILFFTLGKISSRHKEKSVIN